MPIECEYVSLSSDNLILRLAKAAGEVLGKTHDELMYAFGVYMVKRIGNYGYERILKVTPPPPLSKPSHTTPPSYLHHATKSNEHSHKVVVTKTQF